MSCRHEVLLTSFCRGLSYSIRAAVAEPVFIYLLTHSNTSVGIAETLHMLCNALAAAPAGLLLDCACMKGRTTLRLVALLGLVAVALLLVAVAEEQFPLLCVAMALLGSWNAFQVAEHTVAADSIQTAAQFSIHPRQSALVTSSTALGPGVAMLVFYIAGNEWSIPQCRYVIYGGTCVTLVVVLLQLCFLDGEAEEGDSTFAEAPSEVLALTLTVPVPALAEEACALVVTRWGC